ncbi:hypothetical protein SPRG_03739 [Saprolegnia parasitica CBS 223.65]|uniref:FYVE-type domain-containing protein n=1 Tax=Saprolegnia parasitica (strain CBS 223.65) TaxID=695850 RepID=A0A067CMA5_SAPPC|nr:hypothetical protein SPRG_03739 [Saprolegnia parasitica CBS 223.65]KDO31819.1 hypothetical protein SPRG_03739 [Saprolegnia parasitica CBS 223.65]|eukprot:XP_012197699.1 hypothetical protein SPRG_03739 [Saprolegnia parasitica CBS 223.65]
MRESLSWGGVDKATWGRLSCADHHEDLGATSACRTCRATFNVFVRKHHCHLCGRLMCSSCLESVDIDKDESRRSSAYGFRATALSSMRSQVPMAGPRLRAKLCVDCCTSYVHEHMYGEVARTVALKASYTVQEAPIMKQPRTSESPRPTDRDTFYSTVSLPRPSTSMACASTPSCSSEEDRRLDALRSLNVLDTAPAQLFDVLAAIAGATYDCPMAGISFVDADREFFKAAIGFPGWDLPRHQSLGAHAVRWKQPVALCNKRAIGSRFRGHPWLKGPLHLQFYASVPLQTSSGHVVGCVFVMDTRPRASFEAAGLREVATSILAKLELDDDDDGDDSVAVMQSVLSAISSVRSDVLSSMRSDLRSVVATSVIELSDDDRLPPRESSSSDAAASDMQRMLASLLACQAQTQAILDGHRATYLQHVA